MTTLHHKALLALSDTANLEAWLTLASYFIPEDGEIHLRALVTVSEDQSLSEGATQARQWRETLSSMPERKPAVVEDDEQSIYIDYRPFHRVLEEVESGSFDLLIVQWAGPVELTGGFSTDDILDTASCDVILLHGAQWQGNGPVLLSLRGGPNLTLGTQMAKAIADDSPITLFHAINRQLTIPERTNLEILMRDEAQITRTIATSKDLIDGIVAEAVGHKAIVLGANFRQPTKRRNPVSQTVTKVFEKTQTPLAIVRAYNPEDLEFHTARMQPPAQIDLSTRVDRWFAENSFHSSEFADLEAMMALKEKQGLTISVGLPALNEEKTVGKVIRTLKSALMDAIPFIDEIVLIDSNSTDNTVAIAESLGVPVYRHPDILPEVGTFRGKGEALWKSLHVLKGDIIAWVDTDITNIHPRFIYGIVGPLLKYPRLQYVKGFYQRPIKVNDKLQAYGGGRVTELVARPMLNLFYPELSGIIQPLSGEYAGRRSALEQVPFFTGYGVETAMLIDIHAHFGLEGLAQTDLEVRVHHNQPLVGLSKMSFAILQVFIDRIEKRYGTQLLEMANRSMKLIVHEPDRFGLEIQDIADIERPPMISVPTYGDRHGKNTAAD